MITNVSRRCTARHRGYTLAEAMMAVVVLSAAAAGVLLPFSSGAAVQYEGLRRTLAAKLAADLIQQTLTEGAYDGYSYSEPQGQVKDASGTVFTDPRYTKFGRDVSCQCVYVPQESGTTAPQFIRITVRVYYAGREIATMNRLVAE